jgi:phytoene dehydrogenase-like protein
MVTITFEGELLDPWVSSVRGVCTSPGRIWRWCLDLPAVTQADAGGAQLLRDLMREDIDLAACSSLPREWSHREDQLVRFSARQNAPRRRARTATHRTSPRREIPLLFSSREGRQSLGFPVPIVSGSLSLSPQ